MECKCKPMGSAPPLVKAVQPNTTGRMFSAIAMQVNEEHNTYTYSTNANFASNLDVKLGASLVDTLD